MRLPVLLTALLVSSVPATINVFAQDGEASVPEAAKRWSWSEGRDYMPACAKKSFADFDVTVVQKAGFRPLDEQHIRIEGVAPTTTVTLSYIRIKKGEKVVL